MPSGDRDEPQRTQVLRMSGACRCSTRERRFPRATSAPLPLRFGGAVAVVVHESSHVSVESERSATSASAGKADVEA